MKYTFDYRNQTISEVLNAGVLPKTTYVGMTSIYQDVTFLLFALPLLGEMTGLFNSSETKLRIAYLKTALSLSAFFGFAHMSLFIKGEFDKYNFKKNFKVEVICRADENSSDLVKYTLGCKDLGLPVQDNEYLIQYKISNIEEYTEGFSNELETAESF
jgi:hypothetical protein